jgi:hypothetical protein
MGEHQMRRQQRPLASRMLRAVIPLGRRSVVVYSMLSAVADAIGAREGTVLADTPGGGDLAGGLTLKITTIRPGDPQETARTQIAAAQQLGYELDERPRAEVVNAPDVHWYRFADVHWLPKLAFAIAAPGQSVDGLTVPHGSVGIRFDLFAGSTSYENGKVLKTRLNQATTDHLRRHGVNFAPPAPWQRYWFWWWTRCGVRLQLAVALRTIGAARNGTAATWFFGPELVGPYTLAVAAIQPGTARPLVEAAEAFQTRRQVQGDLKIGCAIYVPGEQIDPAAPAVPDGSSGVIVTVTHRRTRQKANAN